MENKELYSEYMKAFLAENSKVNLISKNDEKFLWEKHVCDSLAISEFFDKYKMLGIITYIRSSPDNPKKVTLLRQTNPFILPKFNISVL